MGVATVVGAGRLALRRPGKGSPRGRGGARLGAGSLRSEPGRKVRGWLANPVAANAGKGEGEEVETSTTAPQSQAVEDKPVWVQREEDKELQDKEGKLPFGVYLLASCIVAIAAVSAREKREFPFLPFRSCA